MLLWWQKASPARRAQVLCAAAALIVVLILLLTPKPWSFDLAAAKKIKLRDYVRVYSWWAGLINLLPLAALALSARWWTQSLPAIQNPQSKIQNSKWFWPVVAAAMVLCGALNAPRLSYSLWDDEEYSVRRVIVGSYPERKDGTIKLKPLNWTETLWYYSKPTNHILQSIAARVSNDLWRTIARPSGLQFWEPALRLPSFLAGLAAIGVVALVVRRMGFPAAGAIAAVILALHPWYARFVPEARGYTLVFLLLGLQWLCLLRAIESRGLWRWWIGFALAQFAMLWTWPASGTIAAVNNLLIVTWFLFSPAGRPQAVWQLGRWFAVSCVSGMAVVQMLLPCVPQFSKYLADATHAPMEGFWLKNVGSLLVTGSHWSKSGRLDFRYPEFYPFAHAYPWLAGMLFFLAGVFVLAGGIRLTREKSFVALFPALWLVPALVVFAMAKAKDCYLYEWYVCFTMPGLAALTALGLTTLGSFFPATRPARMMRWGLLVALLAGYAAITQRQRHFLMTRSVQNLRESVLLTRPTLNPHDPANEKILTVSTILSPAIYDPRVEVAPSLESLSEFLHEADKNGRPVYLNQGGPSILKTEFPATYAMVTDPTLFEEIADLPGIEEMLDRKVYRYKSGAIAGKDLKQYGTNPEFNRAFIY